MKDSGSVFARVAKAVSNAVGSPVAFFLAASSVVAWAASGPFFRFSQTWQLVINTGTTIVTFLMVFIIHNTENRDGKAVQLKLDELIRATREARSGFVDLEDLDDAALARLEKQFQQMRQDFAEDSID